MEPAFAVISGYANSLPKSPKEKSASVYVCVVSSRGACITPAVLLIRLRVCLPADVYCTFEHYGSLFSMALIDEREDPMTTGSAHTHTHTHTKYLSRENRFILSTL